jgi:hypothetical protein
VQVQLRQHLPELIAAPLEQRQHAALEALLEISDPRTAHRHRPRSHGQLARLAVAVAVTRARLLQIGATLRLGAAQKLAYLLLQQILQPALNATSGMGLHGLVAHA